jgi:hypothetical protein
MPLFQTKQADETISVRSKVFFASMFGISHADLAARGSQDCRTKSLACGRLTGER